MRLSNRLPWFVFLSFLTASPALAQTTVELFREDFESGASRWMMEGFWHVDVESGTCQPGAFPSGTHAAWYGQKLSSGCTYDGYWSDFLHLTSSTLIPLPASGASTLSFWSRSDVESDTFWDTRTAEIWSDTDGSWTEVFRVQPANEPWTLHTIDLSAYAGRSIRLRFVFWAGDSWDNDNPGWLVDDVVVTSTSDYPVSCLGDGSATPCPCGNASAPSQFAGCLNSQGTPGALRATGVASLANDSLRLWGSGMTNTTVAYYQGGSLVNGGAGHVYGDGLNCTGGPIRRLGTATNLVGDSSVPLQGDQISVRGQVTSPGTRWYQARYRNTPSFCTTATFNSTNQVRVDWIP